MIDPWSGPWFEHAFYTLAAEQSHPLTWWWLSFVDAEKPEGERFLGVAIVQARGIGHAVTEAYRLGINPGGEVVGLEIDAEHVPAEEYRERLLTKAEAEALVGEGK